MKALSLTMREALRVIAAHGGEAHAHGGGYWGDGRSEVYKLRTADYRYLTPIGTQTIYALEDRGMLERLWTGKPYYRDTRRMTEAGRDALVE